jgi:beta-lactamase regulating signal transducer with metallopeptidase domain
VAVDRIVLLLGALLAATLVRGLAVLAAAFAVTALARKLSRESRHLVWFAAIAAFLLIPPAWFALPPLRIGAPIPVQPASEYRLAAAPVLAGAEYARLVDRSFDQAVLARERPKLYVRVVSLALLSTWLCGSVVFAVRLLLGRRRVRRLAAGAHRDARLQGLADAMSARLPKRRRPRVFLSSLCRMPFTFGVLEPVIVLPTDAVRWPPARAAAVLAHEMAHVLRRDIAVQSVAYAVCVLFWFAPPLWLAYAAMLREAEACCDQRVINQGFRAAEYARGIADLVRGSQGRILLPVHSLALVKRSRVRQRIEDILRLQPGRNPLGVLATVGVLAVCLCCLAPLLVLTGAAQPVSLRPDDPYIGTWINEENDRSERMTTAKAVVTPDGQQRDYTRLVDAEPLSEHVNTFEDLWVDRAGNRWYKIRVVRKAYPSGAGRIEGYVLMRINAAGSVMESAFAQSGYPTVLDPVMSPSYSIYYRRP